MITDTHCHLNLSPLYENWPVVVETSLKAGVGRFIVPGTSLKSSQQAVDIAKQNSNCRALIGIHPEASQAEINQLSDLAKLMTSGYVSGIGEIGLDFSHGGAIDMQEKLFRDQLELGIKHNLPVSLHSRPKTAINRLLEILSEYNINQPIIFHCFSGNKAQAWQMVEQGYYLGVGGLITYEHNQTLRKVIGEIPLQNIILETDAPWLSVDNSQIFPNTPAGVLTIANRLALIKQIPLDELFKQIADNVGKIWP